MVINNRIKLTIIHCLIPIIIGGLIYILFRSTSLRMFKWLSFLGFDNIIQIARTYLIDVKSKIPSWVYFSLPDGLWIYSFTSAILIYWNNNLQKAKIWLLIPITSGILFEIFQYFKLFPGTFDFLDLCFSLCCLILSIFTINLKYKQNDKKIS